MSNMHHLRACAFFQPSNLRLAKAIKSTLDPPPGAPTHLFGSAMSVPHTVVARTVAVLGLDFVMVDALHTDVDSTRSDHLASEGKTCAVVRVPVHSELLTHALDAGAVGIIFPNIDTPEQAAAAVANTRYPYSGGDRSLPPSALIAEATDMAPAGSSYESVADEHITAIFQIEGVTGLDHAEAIAPTPGVTSLMLGPSDLRVSLGLPSRRVGAHEAEFMTAIRRLIDISEKHRIPPLMTVGGVQVVTRVR